MSVVCASFFCFDIYGCKPPPKKKILGGSGSAKEVVSAQEHQSIPPHYFLEKNMPPKNLLESRVQSSAGENIKKGRSRDVGGAGLLEMFIHSPPFLKILKAFYAY